MDALIDYFQCNGYISVIQRDTKQPIGAISIFDTVEFTDDCVTNGKIKFNVLSSEFISSSTECPLYDQILAYQRDRIERNQIGIDHYKFMQGCANIIYESLPSQGIRSLWTPIRWATWNVATIDAFPIVKHFLFNNRTEIPTNGKVSLIVSKEFDSWNNEESYVVRYEVTWGKSFHKKEFIYWVTNEKLIPETDDAKLALIRERDFMAVTYRMLQDLHIILLE